MVAPLTDAFRSLRHSSNNRRNALSGALNPKTGLAYGHSRGELIVKAEAELRPMGGAERKRKRISHPEAS
jgi:hypothetical protein